MKRTVWLIPTLFALTGAVTPRLHAIPLSERDTRAEARQLIGQMKNAYTGLKGFTAVVERQALGPADEVDNVDSGRWKIAWAPGKNGEVRFSVESLLATPLEGEVSLYGSGTGPLRAIYDGKQGVVIAPEKKVYSLFVKADEGELAPWLAVERVLRGKLSVASLLNGSNPIQDFPIPLRELRIGKPQLVGDSLCDVVIARFSDNANQPSRWTMTLLIDQELHLLRQVITTGARWDGRERLQIETIVAMDLKSVPGGNTFRLPKVTEKLTEETIAARVAPPPVTPPAPKTDSPPAPIPLDPGAKAVPAPIPLHRRRPPGRN